MENCPGATKPAIGLLNRDDLGSEFLQELGVLYEEMQKQGTQTVSAHELSLVAERFVKWRARTRAELEKLVQCLPVDDPLLCPISLFGPMDYGRLETAHTRVLAWLLDPSKEHGFDSKLLQALLVRVGGKAGPVEVQEVVSELVIDQVSEAETGGRLDVFARGEWTHEEARTSWLLVIEAKIDACEGEEQLARYENWLDPRTVQCEVFRIYLTLDGRQCETAKQEWYPLKFQELAETFRAAADELKDKAGYHYLRFYLTGVLRDICGLPVPIRLDCDDPYSVVTYLRNVIKP